MLGFIAKLGLDTSDFDRKIDKIGDKITGDFNKKLGKAFAGAAAFASARIITEATLGAAREYQSLAAAQKLTIEQFAQLQAESLKSGETFDQLKERIEGTGQSLQDYAANLKISVQAQRLADASRQITGTFGREPIWDRFKKAIGIGGQLFTSDFMDAMRGMFGDDQAMWDRLSKGAGKSLTGIKARERGYDSPIGPMPLPGHVIGSETGIDVQREVYRPNVNQLQSIGAYSGTSMQVMETRVTNQILRTIEGNTRQLRNGRMVRETLGGGGYADGN